MGNATFYKGDNVCFRRKSRHTYYHLRYYSSKLIVNPLVNLFVRLIKETLLPEVVLVFLCPALANFLDSHLRIHERFSARHFNANEPLGGEFELSLVMQNKLELEAPLGRQIHSLMAY